MATITVAPQVLKNYLLKIAADQYEKHVNSVTLTPSAAIQTWKGGTPADVFSDTTTPTWTLDIGYAQDWTTSNSLSQYLLANVGKTVAVEFSPLGTGPKFTANVIIVPGAMGGAIDAYGASTVSLGVQGQPIFVAAAAGIPIITASTPVTGPVAGSGPLVKVSGSGFLGTTSVKFGTLAATTYTIDGDGTIWAQAPAQAAGSKPVTVTNATGVSVTTGAYLYV